MNLHTKRVYSGKDVVLSRGSDGHPFRGREASADAMEDVFHQSDAKRAT